MLTELLSGCWTAEAFSELERSLRRWARRSAGVQLVHNSRDIAHTDDCPKRKSSGRRKVDHAEADKRKIGTITVLIWYIPGAQKVLIQYICDDYTVQMRCTHGEIPVFMMSVV